MGKRRSVNTSSDKPVASKLRSKKVEKDIVPDRQSDDYYLDEIDQFHAERDTIPLDTKFANVRDDSASEEEVLAVESDDDSDDDDDLETEMTANLSRLQRNLAHDDMASDIEDPEDGLPDSQAWGTMRHKFYGADVHDDDDLDSEGSELGAAELEEQEALAIQKRLAEQLDDQDFDLDSFKPIAKVVGEKDEIIVTKDLSKLSRREKLELLKKESPEFLDLIEDYKIKMEEASRRLHPVLMKIRAGKIPQGPAAVYVDTKFRLILSYCVNVSYYMMLKAKHEPVHIHPVINRIVQYRGLLKQLETADEAIEESLDRILVKIKNGEELTSKVQPARPVAKTRKKSHQAVQEKVLKKRKKVSELLDASDDEADVVKKKPKIRDETAKSKPVKTLTGKGAQRYETKDEREALEYYSMMKAGRRPGTEVDGASSDEEMKELRGKGEQEGDDSSSEGEGDLAGRGDEDDQEGAVGKRGITKQILKNRGLTPHRNKDNKNPRVKHRKKYKKAQIRRRGAVREYRPETKKYGGELSGIRAGVKKSIKLK